MQYIIEKDCCIGCIQERLLAILGVTKSVQFQVDVGFTSSTKALYHVI